MRSIKKIIADLDKQRKKLGAVRDGLRDLSGEVEGQLDDAQTALDDLDSCIEKLSEQV